MKKILFSLFLFIAALCYAQNDDCSGAISLTVGTDFNSGMITANNTGATTDGDLPSCNNDAVENVWFTAVVPASGNIKIETREINSSFFDDATLSVYSGTCGSLTEIECNDYGFSGILLTGQTPGTTLYISVWKYDFFIDNGEFQISAYDPIPPANDDCSGAIPLTVGTDFNSGMITSDNTGATTDGDLPSCDDEAIENMWFTAIVPASGNINIEMRETNNSLFDDAVLTVYSGTCGSLTEIECSDYGFSEISLTGQTPGATLYISVWKYDSYIDNGEFQISAYDPIPPANDNCSGAIALTVGADFNSGMVTANNMEATTDGDLPSCNDEAVENVWFSVIVPASGNIKIETREAGNSLFDAPTLTVYNGACGSLTEVECSEYGFSSILLTGQIPGTTLYVSVWKYNSYIDNGEFQISAYDPIPPANDHCSGAVALTVGTDFNSGMITANNLEATTDGELPSCNDEAAENVWFSVIVPSSGNIKIETREADNSLFDVPTLTVYTGTCGSLTEIECNEYGFSSIALTGQTPGATLYVSVWKYSSYARNGEFKISAYDPIPPANDNCPEAIPLTVGTNFNSNAITSSNSGATTDGDIPACRGEATENVWFTVTVPQSGNIKIETQEADSSSFSDTTLTVYSGTCSSLTEIGCDDDSGEDNFSLISLTGQTPGTTLYVSVWKYTDTEDNGEFRISAYDTSVLSTHETAGYKKKITLYPNPFYDQIHISDVSQVKTAIISDSSGRLIKTIENPSATIYLSDLKAGMYFITLKMKDGTAETIKIIKK
ncbi:MAG: T9SS type A sorting domain-containing protein [Chryseobacterium sp.]|jgi:hypothetical protein|uniref:T9SS type A sorting domain-containing protein n=1 Tax=Chryseobacterium sp. TaxID=1871047 RepID=UPI002830F353|nr:T9SS type A sorting domain-containing protein [Chryseobacterium sp.]MDR2234547.1 T9SS type A sorting domain-containing protein [Chryseobacterium sp.]